jgi:hypothetical protein
MAEIKVNVINARILCEMELRDEGRQKENNTYLLLVGCVFLVAFAICSSFLVSI